ncbi:universal stress protein [Amycolatopsis benzoatilytica]|uniref:universal stress protein n=1 Tax=Amycolatopsis benzoatilytica TaxID=346045 RepID=UPI0003817B04|nr:universal stress protein [Amycolatopsis benzoatilytica]
MTRPVVAGVDGSAAALAAVRWAAAEAVRRGTELVVFRAELVDGPDLLPHRKPLGDAEMLLEPGYRQLCVAAEAARSAVPAVAVRRRLRLGAAAEQLIAMSGETELIVLGSHGVGGLRGAVIGSVALRTAALARCPVAVVRGRAEADGPVVVGIDESDRSERALAVAFEAAAARAAAVEAVHVWHDGSPGRESALRDQVAAWSRKHPEVPVRVHLVRARSAARALSGMSSGAQLVVVGSRGRGPVAGGLLGSTGNWLLAHADCPVEVAR